MLDITKRSGKPATGKACCGWSGVRHSSFNWKTSLPFAEHDKFLVEALSSFYDGLVLKLDLPKKLDLKCTCSCRAQRFSFIHYAISRICLEFNFLRKFSKLRWKLIKRFFEWFRKMCRRICICKYLQVWFYATLFGKVAHDCVVRRCAKLRPRDITKFELVTTTRVVRLVQMYSKDTLIQGHW